MKERRHLKERKKEEKSEKSKDINSQRKEELSKNKPKDLPKNKEKRRNNKCHINDFKCLNTFICRAIIIFVSYEIIRIK